VASSEILVWVLIIYFSQPMNA